MEQNFNFGLENGERQKLEEITKKKISNIVFNSFEDDWSKDTSVFDDKIKGKGDLLFLIEDDKKNKFGGVYYGKVDKSGYWLKGDTSFIFSLVRNGELNPKIFLLKEGQADNAFISCLTNNSYLFAFGNNDTTKNSDIDVGKCGSKYNKCTPTRYTAQSGDLINGQTYTPKSIHVFQLSN
ncbi:hypothetical protein EIN_103380 [Entamoeba invadens IP1]|uniref:TLDc domain-containing protein n=1 Tax=Entamoeba invadens IP1 TaxID=370355 RepID=A0A0A1U9M4_ENTIV|nr:hypothetical protein EIN_103380 [Entamoeba invadens IP1]ELP88815.1 hypothetical protein EIN_103380 [Entamoeba invadens IP1]|eukprot:XP_004255586.1 hypothetical protein EIN_103380 [Entamoeba invadens IP1]